jgi:adenylate cyclase
MVAVKGKAEPLQIFEPIGPDNAEFLETFQRYDKALTLYRARRFADAALIWEEIGDGPSLVMAARAHIFTQTPPQEPWDGVWVMTTK